MHWEAHVTVWFTENEREEKYCITTNLKAAGAPTFIVEEGDLVTKYHQRQKRVFRNNKRVVGGWVPMTELPGPGGETGQLKVRNIKSSTVIAGLTPSLR